MTSQIHYYEITKSVLQIFMGFFGVCHSNAICSYLVRTNLCSVWACLWMSGTLFTILIEISHYAYFIVLKNCRVLVVIWPTWSVTWDHGYESHWIHTKNWTFFFFKFFFFFKCIYTMYIINTGCSIRKRGKVITFCVFWQLWCLYFKTYKLE